jgi:hypothetical protein
MRALERIALDARSASLGDPVKLDWLCLAELYIDDSYQRDVGAAGLRHVKAIAAKFNWSKFSPVIVNKIPEGYAIIDGQHRCLAALALGLKKVPCSIVKADGKVAAAVFAAVNGQTRRMTSQSVFKAALAAGEDWAVAVAGACAATGVVPLTHPIPASRQKPFSSNATGRMQRYVQRHGRDFLHAVLRVVVAKPYAHVAGFINSTILDDVAGRVLAQPDGLSAPLVAAARMVEGLQRAGSVGLVAAAPLVVPVAVADEAGVLARVKDLKARGFTKTMVAASLRLKYADVERLWAL